MLPGPITCTEPPLKKACVPALFGVGVTTIVTVAVEPDCSEGRLQLTMEFVEPPPPQVPAVVLAETNVNGTIVFAGLRLSNNVMLVAKSGPVLVTV
jgi:hypothetical protein